MVDVNVQFEFNRSALFDSFSGPLWTGERKMENSVVIGRADIYSQSEPE